MFGNFLCAGKFTFFFLILWSHVAGSNGDGRVDGGGGRKVGGGAGVSGGSGGGYKWL